MKVWTNVAISGRKAIVATAVAVASLMASNASAAVFYPSGSPKTGADNANDLNDLDHAYYYAWEISNTAKSYDTNQTLQQLKTAGITSASITFQDLYNWDNKANVLHLDLLDYLTKTGTLGTNYWTDTGTSTVYYAQDNAPETATKKTDMTSDAFDNASGSSNRLGNSTKVELTDKSFLGQGLDPTRNPGPNDDPYDALKNKLAALTGGSAAWAETLVSAPGWSFSVNATGGWDYTYTFTDAQLSKLIEYIDGDGIALAFDPDCHFYNDQVYFTVLTGGSVGGSAVPEPASLLLLGTGLFVAGRYRRKKQD